jgi:glycosyltransferase involved in cell wall biosynthesis
VTPYQVPDSAATNSRELRRLLGLNDENFVIGHVGRFVHQKNHAFLIDLAAECVRREPQTRLVLVGHGGLRALVEQAVTAKGLADRVIFAGVRSDVARLMTEVFDVFVMPSLYEGLGVALIEAQTAGLPCVISDAIPKEATAVIPLVQCLSLRASIDSWADAVLSARTKPRSVTRMEALELITSSSFNIHNCVKKLQNAYGRRP